MDDLVEAAGKRRAGLYGPRHTITQGSDLGCAADRDAACHSMAGSSADIVHTQLANNGSDSDGDGPC